MNWFDPKNGLFLFFKFQLTHSGKEIGLIRNGHFMSGDGLASFFRGFVGLFHFLQIDGHFVNRSGKPIGRRDAVVLNNGRFPVLTHIRSFVSRKNHPLRVFNPSLGNLLVIDENCPRSSLTQTAAVVSELKAD